jgi:alanine dehydrogenase
MGTDTVGKQEIDAQIFARAKVFTDEIPQAITLGETQHAIAQKLIHENDITAIGDVINGTHAGRGNDDEVTVFDGTGVGLQDLAAASASLRAAIEQGKAVEIEL